MDVTNEQKLSAIRSAVAQSILNTPVVLNTEALEIIQWADLAIQS